MRRVELTHDVLCGVVKASRDLRHERESREATEKMLAEQRERAAAARHALVRARQVAAVCIVLAVGAVAAAIFAYFSSQRAKRAEDLAQQSRVQAETLLGYLTAGFARELENSGRLDVIASLAKREIDYFHGLPADLKGPETQRTAAQALVQFARAQRRLGRSRRGLGRGLGSGRDPRGTTKRRRRIGGDDHRPRAGARRPGADPRRTAGREGDARVDACRRSHRRAVESPGCPGGRSRDRGRGPGDAGIPADRRQRPESRGHAGKSRCSRRSDSGRATSRTRMCPGSTPMPAPGSSSRT